MFKYKNNMIGNKEIVIDSNYLGVYTVGLLGFCDLSHVDLTIKIRPITSSFRYEEELKVD